MVLSMEMLKYEKGQTFNKNRNDSPVWNALHIVVVYEFDLRLNKTPLQFSVLFLHGAHF